MVARTGRPRIYTEEQRREKAREHNRNSYQKHREDRLAACKLYKATHRRKVEPLNFAQLDTERADVALMAWQQAEADRRCASIVEALYAALPRPAQALLHAFEASGYDLAYSAEMIGISEYQAASLMKQIQEAAAAIREGA